MSTHQWGAPTTAAQDHAYHEYRQAMAGANYGTYQGMSRMAMRRARTRLLRAIKRLAAANTQARIGA